jgi:hypothetical protein
MENTKVLKAMANYIEDNGINAEKVRKMATSAWLTAKEWSDILGMTISSQRMTSMYNAGLVVRTKDKKYFGDNNYHYFPTTTPINDWE